MGMEYHGVGIDASALAEKDCAGQFGGYLLGCNVWK